MTLDSPVNKFLFFMCVGAYIYFLYTANVYGFIAPEKQLFITTIVICFVVGYFITKSGYKNQIPVILLIIFIMAGATVPTEKTTPFFYRMQLTFMSYGAAAALGSAVA